jgi:hypothetical protein
LGHPNIGSSLPPYYWAAAGADSVISAFFISLVRGIPLRLRLRFILMLVLVLVVVLVLMLVVSLGLRGDWPR